MKAAHDSEVRRNKELEAKRKADKEKKKSVKQERKGRGGYMCHVCCESFFSVSLYPIQRFSRKITGREILPMPLHGGIWRGVMIGLEGTHGFMGVPTGSLSQIFVVAFRMFK